MLTTAYDFVLLRFKAVDHELWHVETHTPCLPEEELYNNT